MPIHGEYRMLQIHVKMAQECGVPKQNCFIMQNGDVLALTKNSARIAGHFAAGDVYVDGNGIGKIGNVIIHDRQLLSQEGLVVIVATINPHTQMIEAGPDLLSRGFVYMRQSGKLLSEGRRLAFNVIRKSLKRKRMTKAQMKENVIQHIQSFLYQKTRRRPLIMPMLITDNK